MAILVRSKDRECLVQTQTDGKYTFVSFPLRGSAFLLQTGSGLWLDILFVLLGFFFFLGGGGRVAGVTVPDRHSPADCVLSDLRPLVSTK